MGKDTLDMNSNLAHLNTEIQQVNIETTSYIETALWCQTVKLSNKENDINVSELL